MSHLCLNLAFPIMSLSVVLHFLHRISPHPSAVGGLPSLQTRHTSSSFGTVSDGSVSLCLRTPVAVTYLYTGSSGASLNNSDPPSTQVEPRAATGSAAPGRVSGQLASGRGPFRHFCMSMLPAASVSVVILHRNKFDHSFNKHLLSTVIIASPVST